MKGTEKFHKLFLQDPQADLSTRLEQHGELLHRIWSETFGDLSDEGAKVTLLLLLGALNNALVAHFSSNSLQVQCEIDRTTPTPADRAAVRMIRENLWAKWETEWKRLDVEAKKKRKEPLTLKAGEQVCNSV